MSNNGAPLGTAPVSAQENKPAFSLQTEPTAGQQIIPPTAEPEAIESPTEKEQPQARPQTPTATESASAVAEYKEHPTRAPAPEEARDEDTSVQKAGMNDVLSDEYAYPRPKRGEIRQGRVIAIKEDGITVDLSLKREGFVPADDLQQVGSDVVATLSVGDEIPVYVIRPEDDKEGNILVSWHRARQEQDWIDAQRLYDTGEIWEGKVKGYNRGGLIVPYGKIRGFVPASHITGVSRRLDSEKLQARLAEMVGQVLPLRVLEVDRQNRRLIFSERIARRQWRSQQREKLLSELQEGDHVHGVVSNVCDFGVFVDVGGTDGLVHISELSWRRTSHPSELVKVGDEVDAYVLRVDRERKRIGLSLKQMEPDPWEKAEEKYKVGQLVTGVVTKLTAFGAFAALDDGIEGLIHISELAEVPPKHPSEVVTIGKPLPLRIVKIDNKRRRMGLSLKRISAEEWAEWEEEREAEARPEEEVEPGEGIEPVIQKPPVEEAQAPLLTTEAAPFESPDETEGILPEEEKQPVD